MEVSAYNVKSREQVWKLENTTLFSEPYTDSNFIIIPKTDTSTICISKNSGEIINFPVFSEKTFALIKKLNRTPKWQLLNLMNGKIDTLISWEYKCVIGNKLFVRKKLDSQIFQLSLKSGEAIPLLELPSSILYSSYADSSIFCYLGDKKGILVNPLTKKTNAIEFKVKPFLSENSICLYKNQLFYYTKNESYSGMGYKIVGQVIDFPNNTSN